MDAPVSDIRPGEVAVEAPPATDAGLVFAGHIHTPWGVRAECPRQGRSDGPICGIELFEPWVAALEGIEAYREVEVLYWLYLLRRDLVRQSPRSDGATRGAFALRTPVRPNLIGTARVRLLAVEGSVLLERGLDCLNGTPLIDLKPDRCASTPMVPRQPGDDQVEGTGCS